MLTNDIPFCKKIVKYYTLTVLLKSVAYGDCLCFYEITAIHNNVCMYQKHYQLISYDWIF